MNFTNFFSIAMLIIGFLSSCNNNADKKQNNTNKPPNIIFILADDMGYNEWGCYGQDKIKTPNIDKLASQGIVFTDHYAGSTVCAPSRSTLLSGQHTGHTSVRGNSRDMTHGVAQISKETPIITEILKENSTYETALYGRWHLGGEKSSDQPSMRGFDYSFGKLSSLYKGENSHFIKNMFNKNGEHIPENEYEIVGEPFYENGHYYNLEDKYNKDSLLYTDILVTEKALDYIRKDHEKPFFLYMAYSLAHAPIEIAESKQLYNDFDWPEKEKTYASMISLFDSFVGEITNEIKKLGLSEETLIIVTSDNGPHSEDGHSCEFFDSNGKLKGEKRDLYEGGIRVPLVASWPGKITPGTSSNLPTAFWDYFPTFCDIAKIETPSYVDGISFLPTLLGKDQEQTHEYLYWEFTEGGPKQAIRKGDWKAIRFLSEKKTELYNLSSDLGENIDVSEQFPDKVSELIKLMEDAHKENAIFPLYVSKGEINNTQD